MPKRITKMPKRITKMPKPIIEKQQKNFSARCGFTILASYIAYKAAKKWR